MEHLGTVVSWQNQDNCNNATIVRAMLLFMAGEKYIHTHHASIYIHTCKCKLAAIYSRDLKEFDENNK